MKFSIPITNRQFMDCIVLIRFQKGWLSFLSGIADNSLYPILLLDSLVALLQTNGEVSVFADGWPRIISIMTMVIVLTYLNYRGKGDYIKITLQYSVNSNYFI
jgi:hypothetical protein